MFFLERPLFVCHHIVNISADILPRMCFAQLGILKKLRLFILTYKHHNVAKRFIVFCDAVPGGHFLLHLRHVHSFSFKAYR